MLAPNLGLWTPRQAAWWPSGAIYAADFVNDRYMRNGAAIPAASAYSFTRASTKLADDSNDVWQSFAPNVLARTDRGALIEPAGENLVANSAFVGAQLSTTNLLDGLPTGWDSSKFDGVGVNGRIVAIDTWLGLPSITIRLWGNSSVGDAELRGFLWSNLATNVPAVQGDTVAQSVFIQRVGGSNTNFASRLRLNERNSAGTYVTHQTTTFVASAAAQRPFTSMAISNPATAKVLGGFVFAFGGSFDITLRLAALQLAKSTLPTPSSPVQTAGTAATRQADSLSLQLSPGQQSLTFRYRDLSGQVVPSVGGAHAIDPSALTQGAVLGITASP